MLLVLGLHALDPIGEVRDVDGQLEDVVGDLLVFGTCPFDDVSLDLVDLVMSVEDEFGVEVPEEAVENLKTVGDVVRFIEENK